MVYTATYASPLGELTLASDGENLVGLWTESQKRFGASLLEGSTPRPDLPPFAAAASWLDRYFAGARPSPDELPLRIVGTPFQQVVCDILRTIPYGGLTTYGDVARQVAERMGRERMSSQAVGGAVGRNPLPIVVPCHRVVGAGGNLTGYTGGLDIKVWLLTHEGVDMARLSMPRRPAAR